MPSFMAALNSATVVPSMQRERGRMGTGPEEVCQLIYEAAFVKPPVQEK